MITCIFDLDGVVYRGDRAVPGVADTLQKLSERGVDVLFATNNSARTARGLADKVARVTGYPAQPSQMVSSAMAVGRLARERAVKHPFIVGGEGIHAAVLDTHGRPSHDPEKADGLIVGIDQAFTYATLEAAMGVALRGVPFLAANLDASYPAEEGLRPGAGSIVSAIATASGVRPVPAGKPERPMIELLAETAKHDTIIMIGDRLDTDVAMGKRAGWITVAVKTGVPFNVPTADPPDACLDTAADLLGWAAGAGLL